MAHFGETDQTPRPAVPKTRTTTDPRSPARTDVSSAAVRIAANSTGVVGELLRAGGRRRSGPHRATRLITRGVSMNARTPGLNPVRSGMSLTRQRQHAEKEQG